MSDLTKSSLDSGTVNSDRIERDVTRNQQLEGQRQDAADTGEMRTDNAVGDESAPADQDSAGAASPGRHVGP